jgi:quercetin dioxygenase-like cupin family protein
MSSIRVWTGLVVTISFVAVGGRQLVAARTAIETSHTKIERSRVALSHDLPRMNGDKLGVTIVDVNYGPGESSTPHSHTCPVIGYVLEGRFRTQVQGEAEAVYGPGESFYEAANGIHLVSANASDKEPAKFLAFFVCDHDTPRSVDVPKNKLPGGK